MSSRSEHRAAGTHSRRSAGTSARAPNPGFGVQKKTPALCPFCGEPLYAGYTYGDATAYVKRDTAQFELAGFGPPE